MAVLYSTQSAQQVAGRYTDTNEGSGGKVVVYQDDITLASQATTDTIQLLKVPVGAKFLYGIITTDTSLGTATAAIGVTGTTGKYRAAAVFTATNTPTLFGVVAAMDDAPLTAVETSFITIATAALPASGKLIVQRFYAI